ncbi:MAG: peptide-methionine (S)-S-oxide reductase MsrA [Vulcanimicrobiota bacterium]
MSTLSAGPVYADNSDWKKATFAGGCFWCMEYSFEILDGVKSVTAGYTGGHVKNPTYEQVTTGRTGHYEAIQIIYDPDKVSYEKLLDTYWLQIDPTDPGGQFADRGPQYQTAIFFNDEQQKKIAEKSRKELEESGKFNKPVVVKILEASEFYPAEEYHQDYYKKKPTHYKLYKEASGRAPYLRETWENEKQ